MGEKGVLIKEMLAEEGKDQGFRIPTTFFDLMSILLFVFMILAVLEANKIKHAYQIKGGMLKKQVKTMPATQPDMDTPTFSVVPNGESVKFVFTSQKMRQRDLYVMDGVKAVMDELRPAKLILRIDKKIPSGILQELIIECQEKQIMPFIATA